MNQYDKPIEIVVFVGFIFLLTYIVILILMAKEKYGIKIFMLKLKLLCPSQNLAVAIGADETPFDLEKALSTIQIFLDQVKDKEIHSEEFQFKSVPFEKLSNRTDLSAKDWSILFDKFEEIKNNAIGTERTKLIAKTLYAIEFTNIPFSTAIENVDTIVLDIYAKDSRGRYQFVDDALQDVVSEIQASDLSSLAQDAILHAIDPSKFKELVLKNHKRLELIRDWDVVISQDISHLED